MFATSISVAKFLAHFAERNVFAERLVFVSGGFRPNPGRTSAVQHQTSPAPMACAS